MKRSKLQKKVLEKMEFDKWYTAYDLQVPISTLNALTNRGILKSKSDVGALFAPQTSIEFRLTAGISRQ